MHIKVEIGGLYEIVNHIVLGVDQHPWSRSQALVSSEMLVMRRHQGAPSLARLAATGGLTVGGGQLRMWAMLATIA